MQAWHDSQLPSNDRTWPRADQAPVTLNIYDIGRSATATGFNNVMRLVGSGAYHVGVEVYDLEWSYARTSCGLGITSAQPRRHHLHAYRESVQMGHTLLSYEEVMAVIAGMADVWKSCDYNILSHNCCSFCDILCQHLGIGELPGYVMRLPNTGAAIDKMGMEFDRKISWAVSSEGPLHSQSRVGDLIGCESHGTPVAVCFASRHSGAFPFSTSCQPELEAPAEGPYIDIEVGTIPDEAWTKYQYREGPDDYFGI